MISYQEALKIITQNTKCLDVERVEISQIRDRILAENIIADIDLPPFDRSQMDGFAVISDDTENAPVTLNIIGESAAGKGWDGEIKPGETVRIMTGGRIPQGATAVQKVELTRENGDSVEILEPTKINQNIVRQAAELEKGTQVFATGDKVNAATIASLASFGYAYAKVSKRPKINILATGNEIVEINQTPKKDQIRNSNSMTIKSYAEICGGIAEILPNVSDDLSTLKPQISNAVNSCEILILSGGVSVGKYDFTKTALRELGAKIYFEKVALRPGKPIVFAKLNETLIFGLPGNPVSVAVTFCLFVRTAILLMQNAEEFELKSNFAVISEQMKGVEGRDSFLPAKLSNSKQGLLKIELVKWGGSSDFVSFAKADALVFVPRGEILKADSVAKFYYLPN
ncbi:MAG: molybdopterin molybdotransferase MoeA [Pyrinomonadaceae bacterium]|nr:molybdopterin molybdotransferase MoeA [Pyrinomonadaceae bacterium]